MTWVSLQTLVMIVSVFVLWEGISQSETGNQTLTRHTTCSHSWCLQPLGYQYEVFFIVSLPSKCLQISAVHTTTLKCMQCFPHHLKGNKIGSKLSSTSDAAETTPNNQKSTDWFTNSVDQNTRYLPKIELLPKKLKLLLNWTRINGCCIKVEPVRSVCPATQGRQTNYPITKGISNSVP